MKVRVTAKWRDQLGQDTRRTNKHLYKDNVPPRFRDFNPVIAWSAGTKALAPSGPSPFSVCTRTQVRMSDAKWWW